MVIFNAIKALIFLPLFFYLGYQLNISGFLYLVLAVIVMAGYISANLAGGDFPYKAIIIFPLMFYFGYKFAGTGEFIFVIWGVVTFLVYLGIKALTPD